jgi:hypothetical protein
VGLDSSRCWGNAKGCGTGGWRFVESSVNLSSQVLCAAVAGPVWVCCYPCFRLMLVISSMARVLPGCWSQVGSTLPQGLLLVAVAK